MDCGYFTDITMKGGLCIIYTSLLTISVLSRYVKLFFYVTLTGINVTDPLTEVIYSTVVLSSFWWFRKLSTARTESIRMLTCRACIMSVRKWQLVSKMSQGPRTPLKRSWLKTRRRTKTMRWYSRRHCHWTQWQQMGKWNLALHWHAVKVSGSVQWIHWPSSFFHYHSISSNLFVVVGFIWQHVINIGHLNLYLARTCAGTTVILYYFSQEIYYLCTK